MFEAFMAWVISVGIMGFLLFFLTWPLLLVFGLMWVLMRKKE